MKVWGLTDQGLTEKWSGPEMGVLLGGVKKQGSGFVGIQYMGGCQNHGSLFGYSKY